MQLLQLDPASRLELFLLSLEKSQLLLEPVASASQSVPLHEDLAQPNFELGDLAISCQMLIPQLIIGVRLSIISSRQKEKTKEETGLRFGLVKT